MLDFVANFRFLKPRGLDANEIKTWGTVTPVVDPLAACVQVYAKTYRDWERITWISESIRWTAANYQDAVLGQVIKAVRAVSLPMPGTQASEFGSWDADGGYV